METPPVPPAGTPPPDEPAAGTPPPEAPSSSTTGTPPPEPPLLPAPPSAEERNWAMAAHLSALAGLAFWMIFPLNFLVGPLVVWIIKRDASEFVLGHIKEALNAQITATLLLALCFPLLFVLIGFVLAPVIVLLDIIFIIIAGMAGNDGQPYRYPMVLRLVK